MALAPRVSMLCAHTPLTHSPTHCLAPCPLPTPTHCRRYRDPAFYISHTPGDNDADEKFYALGDANLKDAVLDLTAEDAGGGGGRERGCAGRGGCCVGKGWRGLGSLLWVRCRRLEACFLSTHPRITSTHPHTAPPCRLPSPPPQRACGRRPEPRAAATIGTSRPRSTCACSRARASRAASGAGGARGAMNPVPRCGGVGAGRA